MGAGSVPERLAHLLSARRVQWTLLGLLGIVYAAFILTPIVSRLAHGQAFGGDVGEYLLTAHQNIAGGPAPFHYLFPVVPLLYLPPVLAHAGFVVEYVYGDLLGGVLTVLLFAAAGAFGYAVGRGTLGAAASAVTVGTFYLILNEIGWGGQAQTLAFALGLVAVALLIAGPRLAGRWPAPLLAGGLLALAVLTESYAAAYFVAFSLLWCGLHLGRRVTQWGSVRPYWPVLVLPLGALAIVSAAGGSAAASAATSPILPHALTAAAWRAALSDLNFGNVANVYACAAMVGAFSVFAVVGRGWSRALGNLAAAAVLACGIQVFLLTPGIYWDRAPYFLVFPLAVVASAVVPSLARGAPNDQRAPAGAPRRWPRLRRRHHFDVACAAVIVVALAVQSTVAVEQYPHILQFYSLEPSQLAGLTWLRGQSGGALMVAPEALTFPIADASGRPLFPWTQPIWFDTASEQQAAVLASTLVAGREWISAGALTVVNTSDPANTSSPGLFVDRYPYFVKLVDVIEGAGMLPPAIAGGAVTTPESSSDARAETTPVSFTDNSTTLDFTLVKTTSVDPNGTVQIAATFHFTGAASTTPYVGLEVPFCVLRSFEGDTGGATLQLSYDQPGSTIAKFTVVATASVTGGELGVPLEERWSGYPAVDWAVGPSTGGSTVVVDLYVRVEGVPASSPTLDEESASLSAHAITWAIVDTAAEPQLVSRFTRDGTFTPVWSNPTFTIYRVE